MAEKERLKNVCVVTSGKGGVGKTTVTANLGAGLAQLGHRVVLVDADTGLRNLDVVLGLENRVVYDSVDVTQGRCDLRQALVRDKRLTGLYLLPAAQRANKSALGPENMEKICAALVEQFDFVLVDSPAGIDHGFRTAIAAAGEAVLVATPDVPSVRDADRAAELLAVMGVPRVRLLVNRAREKMSKRGELMSPKDVAEVLSLELLGIVPEDERVIAACNRGELAVHDYSSPAGRALRAAVWRFLGEPIPEDSQAGRDGLRAFAARLFGRTDRAGAF